jgi:hypothetical protein
MLEFFLQNLLHSYFPLIVFILFIAYLLDIRTTVISYWHHTFDQTNFSVQDFYETLGKAIEDRKLPNMKIYRVLHNERIFFSPKREYIRLNWNDETFDICAAPYGECFYVSWWFVERTSRIYRIFLRIPIIKLFFTGKTYHRINIERVVEDTVHLCVLQSIDAMTGVTGSTLSETDRAIIRMPYKFNK